MDKPLPPNKPLSDKIAAEAAQKIEHAYCIGEMDERERERKEIAEIIQSALSQSLAARDAQMPTPIEWQAIWDALEFTAQHAGLVSDAHNRVVDKVEALLKGKAI